MGEGDSTNGQVGGGGGHTKKVKNMLCMRYLISIAMPLYPQGCGVSGRGFGRDPAPYFEDGELKSRVLEGI